MKIHHHESLWFTTMAVQTTFAVVALGIFVAVALGILVVEEQDKKALAE